MKNKDYAPHVMGLTSLALYAGGLCTLLIQSIHKIGLGIALCLLAVLIGLQTALYISKIVHKRKTFLSWKFVMGSSSVLAILIALGCLIAGELVAAGSLGLLGLVGLMCFFAVAMRRKE